MKGARVVHLLFDLSSFVHKYYNFLDFCIDWAICIKTTLWKYTYIKLKIVQEHDRIIDFKFFSLCGWSL